MEKKIVFSENAPKPIGPYSQAVRVGELMFLSGQIALDPQSGELKTASFAEECTTVLDNLKAVLEAGGSSMTNLVKVNVFLKDLGKFVEFNGIYEKYIQESKPARACVEVSRLPKDVNIEIEAVALCKE